MKALILYLVGAMFFWSPAKDMAPATEAETTTYFQAIAKDIVVPVLDDNEQPLFPGDADKAETALQVAAVAFKESGFKHWVDDGTCNKRAWRAQFASRKTMCDGGAAFSFWQIHPGYSSPSGWREGMVLEGGGWKNDPDGVTGKDLIADRETAARVALHMMRASLKRSGTLCGYTGEHSPCPKAKVRRELAHNYFLAHPFKPGDEHVATR